MLYVSGIGAQGFCMRSFNGLLGVTMLALAQPALAQYSAYPQAQPAQGYDRLEQYLWDGAVRKNSPDGYQTYLQRYPQGPHADQARYQLDRFYGRAPAQSAYPQASPYPPQSGAAYPPQGAPYPAAPPASAYPSSQTQRPQSYPQQPEIAPAPGYATSPAANYAPQAELQRSAPAPAAAEAALPPAAEPAPPPAPAAAPITPTGEPAVAPPAAPVPVAAVAPATPAAKGSPLFLCRPVFANGAAPFEQAGEAEITAYLQALKVNSVAAYQTYLQAWPHGLFAPAVSELVATREGRAKALAAATVPGPSQAHPRSPVTITPADYPQGATGAGSATAIWEVAEDGCVQYCRVEKSSGSPALDAATCRIVSGRGTYEPARDSAGKPIRAIETGTFSWSVSAK